jgi:Xaa-Pro dipeptidase
MDIERLQVSRKALEDAGLDALVCRLPEHVVMLSGHWPLIGWSFLLFPRDGKPLLVAPHCDEREAAGELWEADRVTFRFGVLGAGDPYAEIARALRSAARGRGWRRLGFEGDFESVAPPWNAAEPAIPAAATRRLLEEVFGAAALVDATGLLHGLRACKTPREQAALRRVNEISRFGLEAFRQRVAPGVSGVELVAAVEQAIMVQGTGYQGARRVRAFAQVATGAAETAVGYRPMVISTSRPLESGDLALLELAVVADGFWCDRTRVRAAGRPTPAQQAAFAAVLAAQQAAIAAVKPGVAAGAVDQAARRVIHQAGYTDAEFLHVTGHGLGFRYHEPSPLLCPGGETLLREGMTHTVEPGLYRADWGGARIEDNILVTPAGAEVMGAFEAAL